ncbi:hypothetical protein PRK78_002519 [Emydomyces testavorans]|uniref:RNase H type-1 domain-containing protein n=1 Tax=Emydomyces testavorans TaxID=2070801 RepID=A0AAF0DEH7_9EURO|nr:hypothetical protein PRK78_002519 [Emydomyces testavorans]
MPANPEADMEAGDAVEDIASAEIPKELGIITRAKAAPMVKAIGFVEFSAIEELQAKRAAARFRKKARQNAFRAKGRRLMRNQGAPVKAELRRAPKQVLLAASFQAIALSYQPGPGSTTIASKSYEFPPVNVVGPTSPLCFAGHIDRCNKMTATRRALKEVKLHGKIPNRHVFWVDGSTFYEQETSGAAVVWKHGFASWVMRGYHIPGKTGPDVAEFLAILEALEIAEKETATTQDSKEVPTAVAIYSDAGTCLSRIKDFGPQESSPPSGLIKQIILQSQILNSRGIHTYLFWVPGHLNIPGNELAHRVARNAARRGGMGHELTKGSEQSC